MFPRSAYLRGSGTTIGGAATGDGARIGNPFDPMGFGTEPGEPGGAMIGKPFGPMRDGGTGPGGRGGKDPPPPP